MYQGSNQTINGTSLLTKEEQIELCWLEYYGLLTEEITDDDTPDTKVERFIETPELRRFRRGSRRARLANREKHPEAIKAKEQDPAPVCKKVKNRKDEKAKPIHERRQIGAQFKRRVADCFMRTEENFGRRRRRIAADTVTYQPMAGADLELVIIDREDRTCVDGMSISDEDAQTVREDNFHPEIPAKKLFRPENDLDREADKILANA